MDTENVLILIEECRQLIKLKGSRGSGGWGHSGRPGKHGGSKAGSGGLRKIGAKPGSSVENRRKLASKKPTARKIKPAPKKVAGGLTSAMAKMDQQEFNAHLMSQIQAGKLNMQDAQKLNKLHAEQAPKKKAVSKKKPITRAQEVRDKLAELDTTNNTKAKAVQRRRDRVNKKQEKIRNRVTEAREAIKIGKMSKKEGEFIEMRAHEELRKTSKTMGTINRDEKGLRDETAIKKQRKLLYAKGGPANITTKFRPGFSSARKKETQEGIDEFAKMVGKGTALDGMTIGVNNAKEGRSFASGANISMSKTSSKKVVVHEMGHVFENTSKLLDAGVDKRNVHTNATDFLSRRTKGEKAQKLKDLTGISYDSSETTKPDKFRNPYTGKVYEHGATEIMSMGLEQMFDNPAKFAKDDPDFFDFVFTSLENARS